MISLHPLCTDSIAHTVICECHKFHGFCGDFTHDQLTAYKTFTFQLFTTLHRKETGWPWEYNRKNPYHP